jgi:hypothetical protein
MNIKSYSVGEKLGGILTGFGSTLLTIISLPFKLLSKLNWIIVLFIVASGGWLFAGYMNLDNTLLVLGFGCIITMIIGLLVTNDFEEFTNLARFIFVLSGILGFYYGGKIPVDSEKVVDGYVKDPKLYSNRIEYVGSDEMTKIVRLDNEIVAHMNRFKDSDRFKTIMKETSTKHIILSKFGYDIELDNKKSVVYQDMVAKKPLFTVK